MTETLPAPARSFLQRRLRLDSVVALGDSITSGEGVGILTPPSATWAAVLAGQVGATSFTNLSRAGAHLSHIRAEQLPTAVALRPRLATLCVGLNDVVKTGCPADTIASDLAFVIGSLRAVGATVVVTRLHDPTAVFRLPYGLAQQLAARVRLFNTAVDRAAAGDPGVLVVDLAALEADRANWSVDRVHPSVHGQLVLASLAAGQLGLTLRVPADAPRPPSTAAHLQWLLRHGMPWLAQRYPEVGPPMAAMAMAAVRRRVIGGRPKRR